MLLPCSMPIVVEYGRWNQKTYDLVPKSHRLTVSVSAMLVYIHQKKYRSSFYS